MSEIRDRFVSLPASIGGAPFQIHVSKQEVGRRRALQELPDTDFIIEQDLGAKADAFAIEGHVAGADYLRKKRALQDVFRGVGPFLLVHPFEGRFLVKVSSDLTISENVKELGRADISFTCRRATRDDINQAFADQRDTFPASATAVRSTAVAAAASAASRLSVAEVRAKFRERVNQARTVLAGSLGVVTSVAGEVSAATVASVDAITDVADSLVESPLEMFAAIAETTRAVIKAPLVVEATANGVYAQFSDGRRLAQMLGIAGRFIRIDETGLEELRPACLDEEIPDDETDDDAATRNARALTASIRAESIATVVEAFATFKPESLDQALDALDIVNRLLLAHSDGDPDALMYAVDAETMNALATLRAAFSVYVDSTNLPTIQTFVTTSETNAILLAQKLLGDASRFEEIIDRNGLSDPLFIPAGTTIEYLELV